MDDERRDAMAEFDAQIDRAQKELEILIDRASMRSGGISYAARRVVVVSLAVLAVCVAALVPSSLWLALAEPGSTAQTVATWAVWWEASLGIAAGLVAAMVTIR